MTERSFGLIVASPLIGLIVTNVGSKASIDMRLCGGKIALLVYLERVFSAETAFAMPALEVLQLIVRLLVSLTVRSVRESFGAASPRANIWFTRLKRPMLARDMFSQLITTRILPATPGYRALKTSMLAAPARFISVSCSRGSGHSLT